MQIRTPAVAGMFYPGEKNKLTKLIQDCFTHPFGPEENSEKKQSKIFGVICPHAGFVYSGPIACNSIRSISSESPELFIIVGPNHWGIGRSVATMKDCKWETPLGSVEVDSESAEEICKLSQFIESDFFSHTREHSLEVQIPILQQTFSNFKILPISLINQSKEIAYDVGLAMSKIAKKKNTMIIGSSDFTHYEPNDFAHEQDMALIEPILEMDVEKFYDVLQKRKVTACGYGAIASTMIACKELGATKGELLRYATSGDVTGDTSSVVGYGSIVFT
ncbi:MAG: MEMO1 family protein [Nitrosopumilaceae archaeon]|uniref:MEMO1 family protein n=2 Tax=Candidatus Nitrosomaritimum aestuariumsis TaxID=3342354 RepID=A0AC60VXZ1_9ARCH|nr:MEMO1 family protein [Nitrosopumilaceae archaeon]MBA4460208.1 MEMO1 family protein [Nitrosopumilaceae archaeon]MBA4461711.1 MEMO1 family protein [Nitrosopumilaceae archaeon]MBA4462670.1 MEMO1 family protein [Nitrosopumilaceae archaeon]